MARGLSKHFRVKASSGPREVVAVRDFTLAASAGEAIAYLGPNGAGKSTTVKLICGVLSPSSGEIQVLGYDPWRQRTRLAREIAVVFGQRSQLLWDLPVRETFRFLSVVYGLSGPEYRRNLAFAVELMDVGDLLGRPVRELSLGQKSRCELAAAVLHRPKLLLLDEPTIGLDVLAKDRVRAGLNFLRREFGVTVFLASHDFGDVQAICDRAVLIVGGSLRYDGTLADLVALACDTQEIELTIPPGSGDDLVGNLLSLPTVTAAVDGDKLDIGFDPKAIGASDILRRVLQRTAVKDLHVKEPTLEEAIRRLYVGGGEAGRVAARGASGAGGQTGAGETP